MGLTKFPNGVSADDNNTLTTSGLTVAGTLQTGGVQELLASGAVTAGIQSVELNTSSGAIAATVATSIGHQGLFVIKQTDSGTDGHTVTLTVGTFDGSNNVATLNAQNEALLVYFDSAGDGTIIENVGTVGLS